MTTINQAKEAIYLAFETAWDTTGHPFTLDNEDFTPPEGTPWARCVVRHTVGPQDSLGAVGNRKFLRQGSVLVQVYTLINDGTATSDALVKTVSEAFEGKTLPGTSVTIFDMAPRETGPTGKWYQVVVEGTFNYEEIR